MYRNQRPLFAATLTALAAAVSGGCATQPEAAQAPPPMASPPAMRAPAGPRMAGGGGGAMGGAANNQQEAFLGRIKQAAAANGVIRNARMNGDSELGIVVGQQVKLKELKPLMTTLLKEMRESFPGRPLTVRAYAPNNQPMATMRFDPSAPSNSNVTYTTNFPGGPGGT